MISGEGKFKSGEVLLFIDGRDRQYLVTLGEEGEGIRIMDEEVPSEHFFELHEGELYQTPRRKRRFLVFRPSLEQLVMNMPRSAQVIYPKDLALILHYADVYPGQSVMEIGAGHGALSMTLMRALGPEGRLITCDIRQDHLNRTKKNIALYLGEDYAERWEPVLCNPVEDSLAAYQVDRYISDMPEPWDLIGSVVDCLRPGGIWVAYIPSITQVSRLVEALGVNKYFCMINSFETLQRYWHVKQLSVRPEHQMKAHTGFLVYCRRRWRLVSAPDEQSE